MIESMNSVIAIHCYLLKLLFVGGVMHVGLKYMVHGICVSNKPLDLLLKCLYLLVALQGNTVTPPPQVQE